MKIFKKLFSPIVREFPFLCFSFYLIGGLEAIRRVHGHIVSPEPEFSLISLLRNVFVVFFFSYVITALVSIVNKKWIKIFGYFVLLVLYLITGFIQSNFGARICPSVLTLVAETTGTESSEFMQVYASSNQSLSVYFMVLFMLVLILIAELLYNKLKKTNWYHYFCGGNYWVLSIMTTVLLLISFLSCGIYVKLFQCDTTDEVSTWQQQAPQDYFSDIIYSIYDLQLAGTEVAKAIESTRNALNTGNVECDKDSINLILVIGESHIKWHSSLYGYNLKTNPLMEKEEEKGNLFVFQDVVAPFIRTSDNIKNMLCCNSIGDGEKWYDFPYFPAIFKSYGFGVSFFDNQRDWKKTTSTVFALNSYLYDTEMLDMSYTNINDSSFCYDDKIVDYYVKKARYDNDCKKLVVFHLTGQHVGAGGRYPHNSSFNKFSKSDIVRNESWMDDSKRKIIAEYDNATLYNDSVLKKIVDIFRNENTVVVYLSDHGEETYDYRNQYGRKMFDNMTSDYVKYIYEIPFFIWCSDKFLEKNPDIISMLDNAKQKPFSSDNLCQLFFYFGGVHPKYYNQGRNPLVNEYKCPRRIIEKSYIFDDCRKR